jgi:hypothetical protein
MYTTRSPAETLEMLELPLDQTRVGEIPDQPRGETQIGPRRTSRADPGLQVPVPGRVERETSDGDPGFERRSRSLSRFLE